METKVPIRHYNFNGQFKLSKTMIQHFYKTTLVMATCIKFWKRQYRGMNIQCTRKTKTWLIQRSTSKELSCDKKVLVINQGNTVAASSLWDYWQG